MQCKEAQRLSSDYLDGELSPERSAAVRGHLRICVGCEELFEYEAALIEAASRVEPMMPPDSVWQGIQARIAEEEVRDSEGWWVAHWIRRRWMPIAASSALLVAAASLVFFYRAKDSTPRPVAAQTQAPAEALAAHEPVARFADTQRDALEQADRSYIDTIAELRSMIEEDRGQWSEEQAQAVDAKLAAFRKEAIGARLAVSSAAISSHSRDQVYAGYRAEIHFLQNTLAGQLPGGL